MVDTHFSSKLVSQFLLGAVAGWVLSSPQAGAVSNGPEQASAVPCDSWNVKAASLRSIRYALQSGVPTDDQNSIRIRYCQNSKEGYLFYKSGFWFLNSRKGIIPPSLKMHLNFREAGMIVEKINKFQRSGYDSGTDTQIQRSCSAILFYQSAFWFLNLLVYVW